MACLDYVSVTRDFNERVERTLENSGEWHYLCGLAERKRNVFKDLEMRENTCKEYILENIPPSKESTQKT